MGREGTGRRETEMRGEETERGRKEREDRKRGEGREGRTEQREGRERGEIFSHHTMGIYP